MPVYHSVLNVKANSRFQPGDGPSRGLLRDFTTSPINRLHSTKLDWAGNTLHSADIDKVHILNYVSNANAA